MNLEAGLPAALQRPFRVIAFDWDGTAVADRRADATSVRVELERLLARGVAVVVITGTHFGNVDRQLSAFIDGSHKSNLFVATNRGSEVYGFAPGGEPVLLHRRVATAAEERRLTEVAEAVRARIEAAVQKPVGPVYDRMNRRKLDLIPDPSWEDPPKSRIGELLAAVQARLVCPKLPGGIRQAVQWAREMAAQRGLADARITSDVKHVEIGLTDKADAIRWVMRELVAGRGAAPENVLIVGDEFGPIGGVEGSDARMRIPEARGATFVSVGPEPSGAPPGVIHLGGGPATFLAVVRRQAELAERPCAVGPDAPMPERPTEDEGWILFEEGSALAREHEIESIFAISNGYVGTRASLAEPHPLALPATFVAGVFAEASMPVLAPGPDWTNLTMIASGLSPLVAPATHLEHRRTIDLRQGILWRHWRWRDALGRITRIRGLRLVSLADRHALLQVVTMTPENWSGRVVIESAVALAERHRRFFVASPETAPPGTLLLRAVGTGTEVAFAARSCLWIDEDRTLQGRLVAEKGRVVERWEMEVQARRTYRLDRVVAVHTSREVARPGEEAARAVSRLMRHGPARLAQAHVRAWERRWEAVDLGVEGDREAERALRFAAYHLSAAANPDDEHVSIGARALTGPAYAGHVFWDTEIYMLPFFTWTWPEAARSLLMYRFHSLSAARERARRMGYEGALFAWESAVNGEDATPPRMIAPNGQVLPVLSGEQEHHVSADVAYAVQTYVAVSGDEGFLIDAGVEILVEVARFWLSRTTLDEQGRAHVLGAMGPDEYHDGVDDDAYTLEMARVALAGAADAAEWLVRQWPQRAGELFRRLAVGAREPAAWRARAAALRLHIDPRTQVIEQFRGYFQLDDVDLSPWNRPVAMDMVLGLPALSRTTIVKQASVVLLLALFWERFPPAVREASFRYYEPRTAHGSSLSPGMHALAAARLGDPQLAYQYFRQTAEIDLANNMGNAAGGVHAAALGSLWQAAVLGFAGLRGGADGLHLDPAPLPRAWQALRLRVVWHGRGVRARLSEGGERVELAAEGAVPVRVGDAPRMELGPGRAAEARREGGRWKWR